MVKSEIRRFVFDGVDFCYELKRKRIKNLYITVKGDGTACVSAPLSVPICDIEKLLKAKRQNIVGAIQRQSFLPTLWVDEDSHEVCLYGKRRRYAVTDGKNGVDITDDCVTVTCDGADRTKAAIIYVRAIKKDFQRLAMQICDQTYVDFCDRVSKFPTIKFRDMVSRWGSCRSRDGVITLSFGLAIAPPQCIRYVIAHEFSHLLCPDHSKRFYAVLASVLPEHKTLRSALKNFRLQKPFIT